MASLPWRHTLDPDERVQLLGLIRKVLPAAAAQPHHGVIKHGVIHHGEEVSEVLVSAPVTGVDS